MSQRHPSLPALPAADAYPHPQDEIDLVDLAVVLVRRWRLMLVVAVLAIVLGCTAAWLKGASFEYSAIVDIGQGSDGALLDTPEVIQATISNSIVPAVVANAKDQDFRRMAAEIKVDVPKGSGKVIVKVVAPEAKAAEVAELFAQIRQQLLAVQKERFNLQAKPLEVQLDARQEELAQLRQQMEDLGNELAGASGEAKLLLIDRISRLQDLQRTAQRELTQLEISLARMVETRMSEVPQQSFKKEGTSRSLIVVLATVLGGVLAVFAAFTAEFAARVRDRLSA